MGAFLGQYGFIELKRDDIGSALDTVLDPADVNVSKQRFSVDFALDTGFPEVKDEVQGTGSQVVPLITGDRIEIWTENIDANGSPVKPRVPLELVRSNVDAESDTGSKRTVATADVGGTGSGTFWYAVEEVDSSGGIVSGYIQDGGYDYTDGVYTGVDLVDYSAGPMAAGPGSNATAEIRIGDGTVQVVTIETAGTGYEACPYQPDCLKYVHVDEMGGLRLFDSFSDSLSGKKEKSELLTAPTSAVSLKIKTRNSFFRCLAQVKGFSFTTSRESIDVTRLGDQFRRQFEGGLITGQGSLSAIWDFRFRECDDMHEALGSIAYPEFAQYLAQLCIRINEGANFAAKLFIYYPGDNATVVYKEPSVWYEVQCQVTNSAMEVSADRVITTDIDFVSTSVFGLFSDKPPLYLLMEESTSSFTQFILDEDNEPILLQDVD